VDEERREKLWVGSGCVSNEGHTAFVRRRRERRHVARSGKVGEVLRICEIAKLRRGNIAELYWE
jgi:hypothetical protein